MSNLIWLSEAQMRRIELYFPLSHGVPRVDDRRVISGIVFVIRNGLRWRDAPKDYGLLPACFSKSLGGALALLWHISIDWIGKRLFTVWTSSGWRSCEEVENGLSYCWHAGLWRRVPDSFFSVPQP
jgi:hypothetical protein